MILYLDTSALVKLFVREPFDQLVHDLVDGADLVATSRVAYAEACAALARSRREGRCRESALRAALAELKAKWVDFAAVEIDELRAGDLAVKHGLRGFDAIHLAAALKLQSAMGEEPLTFSTFDTRQTKAARAEGFKVFPQPRPVRKARQRSVKAGGAGQPSLRPAGKVRGPGKLPARKGSSSR